MSIDGSKDVHSQRQLSEQTISTTSHYCFQGPKKGPIPKSLGLLPKPGVSNDLQHKPPDLVKA